MDEILMPDAPLPDWAVGRANLASPKMGTVAVRCSDDFFAPMARMLSEGPAVWKPDVYDDNGKWMDGWESRRRRDGGHDWCIVKLGVTGRVAGVDFDTAHFTGNYPPGASVWAMKSDSEPSPLGNWKLLVPTTALGPSAHHFAASIHNEPVNWLKVSMYPDGGLARLRAYGDVVPEWGAGKSSVELSSLINGGRKIAINIADYGEVSSLVSEVRR